MKQINVGMISYAHVHADFRSRALREIPEVKIVAISDNDDERGKKAANTYGVNDFYLDYHDLLKRDDIDLVFIHSENDRHVDQVVAAAEAGKDIFCEKPMATTIKGADKMLSAVEKAGVKMAVGFCSRYMLEAERTKKLVEEGIIGKVVLARSIIGLAGVKEIGCPDYMVDWITDPVKGGGGAFIDEASHATDLLRWLVGEVESVSAFMGNLVKKDLKVEDNGICLLSFKNGALGELLSSWTLKLDIGMRNIVELYGTEGVLVAELTSPLPAVRVYVEKGIPSNLKGWSNPYIAPEAISPHFALSWPTHVIHYRREVQDVVTRYLSGEKFLATGEDGRKSLEIIAAAYESAKTGRKINLPLH